MNASNYIDFNQTPCTQIARSLIKNAGQGLFTTRKIGKGTPVTVYYGPQLTNQMIYDIYTSDLERYYQLSPYLRGNNNGLVINGDKAVDNPNLQGVYVNDISRLANSKQEVTRESLKRYASTLKLCNLRVVDTMDYPVYVSTKLIKKNEELYVHYGIGYWLQSLQFSAVEISELNQLLDFNSFYG